MILCADFGDISHVLLLILTSRLPKHRFLKALSLDKCCRWVDCHSSISRVGTSAVFGVARQLPIDLELLWLLVARTAVRFHMVRVLRLLGMRNYSINGLDKILRICVSFYFVFTETLLGSAGEICHVGYLLFFDVKVLDYVHVSILYFCIF